MKLFVSYARADKAGAARVVERLQQIDHQPWVDARLSGGQSWWQEILRVIMDSDVIVIILSPESLASEACTLERQYALQLGKPVLPVKIAPVSISALPIDLSSLQHVDFTLSDSNDEAAALIRALNRLPRGRPLPNPLPAPPQTPLSYLSSIHDRIGAPPGRLSHEEQLDIVNRLENALRSDDTDEREGGVTLLRRLRQRADVYADTARRIDETKVGQAYSAPSPAPAGYGYSAAPQSPQRRPPQYAQAPNGQQPYYQPPLVSAVQPRGTSSTVKVLAWIGAIVIALILVATILSAGAGGGTGTGTGTGTPSSGPEPTCFLDVDGSLFCQ